MRDIYLYEGTDVLKNLLNIRDREKLEEAESGYVTYRLKEIAADPLSGEYNYIHLLKMHEYIFQDMYEWAGQQRTEIYLRIMLNTSEQHWLHIMRSLMILEIYLNRNIF